MYPSNAHILKTCSNLLKVLPKAEQSKPQILLLAGNVTPYRNDTDREMPFRQESNFYYLTGCDVPSSYLLVTYQDGTSLAEQPSVHLFIPPVSEDDLMWSVPPPSLAAAKEMHQATQYSAVTDLPNAISTLLKAFPNALFHTLPGNNNFPAIPEAYTSLITSSATVSALPTSPRSPRATSFNLDEGGHGLTELYLQAALHLARLTKDESEIELIRKANAISSRAHETVMRVLGNAAKHSITSKKMGLTEGKALLPGQWLIEKEAEAEAIFVASCRREGAPHQAYLPIVASSHRAATLHYCCNDRAFAWGPIGAHDHKNDHSLESPEGSGLLPQVLLIDAGCEHSNYASDITRTMPVGNGGKFTKEAGEIYDLVWQMQQAVMKHLSPGVHWDYMHLLSHRVLIKGLIKLGIIQKPVQNNSASATAKDLSEDEEFIAHILHLGLSAAFYPHGLGHSLGLDVHDVPSISKPLVNPTLRPLSEMPGDMAKLLGLQAPKDLPGPDGALFRYLRLRLPLKEGMVVTVEPGCYFHEHLHKPLRTPVPSSSTELNPDAPSFTPGSAVASSARSTWHTYINQEKLALYTKVGGVRIEDVVVLKEGGYENLTTVRSDREWIEGVCAGVL